MKELKVNALLYMEVDDDITIDDAIDTMLLRMDLEDVHLYIIEESFQNEDGEEIV